MEVAVLDVQVLVEARLFEAKTEEKASQRLGPQPATTPETIESTVELEYRSRRDVDPGWWAHVHRNVLKGFKESGLYVEVVYPEFVVGSL